jgi:LacI family transcriptional regulator
MKSQKLIEGKAITIYDIAKEAGVSPATVSRVLTNKTNVSQKKKDKVQALINKYDYRPNALARGLSDTKSKVIGIIAADIRNPFYAEVFVACEIAAKEAGYTVLLCNSFGLTELEEEQLDMLQQQKVDVIIQLGGRADDLISDQEYVEKVNSINKYIPMVVTGKLEGTQCYQVQIDAEKAAELVLEHLIGMGHKKIVLMGGRKTVVSTYAKYQEYKKILQKYSIDFHEDNVIEGNYDYDTGYASMNQLIDKKNLPTAVVAINDFLAAGVIRSLHEHGYVIPDDISVVSYDNVYIANMLTPKLTSVDYNYEDFGKALVETAISIVEKKQKPLLQKVIPTLVIRESSGVAPMHLN